MKPTFALDLTRDAIALLHRTPKGWLSIGDVAFDAPDLDEALDYLRKTALGLSPMGMATKIVLPASQILYTEVHAPGPSRDDKRRQIAAGLEGRTPYPVEDLVFDWSGKGATVKVAVVARETLDEAEGFAIVHRLNPVSFVAIPEDGSFVGEPWFGPTAAAATVLAPGESVDRDREPVTILHRDLPGAEPAAGPPPKPEPEAEEPLPGLEEALNAEVPVDDLMDVPPAAPEPLTPDLEDQDDTLPGGQAPDPSPGNPGQAHPELAHPELADPKLAKSPDEMTRAGSRVNSRTESGAVSDAALSAANPAPSGDGEPAARPMASSTGSKPEARRSNPETSADSAPVTLPEAVDTSSAVPAPEVEEAPFAHVTDTAAFPDAEEEFPSKGEANGASAAFRLEGRDDDIPPAPPSAAMAAFASRRSAATAASSARPVEGAIRADGAAAPATRLGPPAARTAPAKGFAGLVTAPSIPGTRAKPKTKLPAGDIARPVVGGPTTVKSPARPGGTFGTTAPPRSRSGIVFLVLVALLLLFLALVAAWASFYLKQAENAAATTTDIAIGTVPDIEDEMLADMQDPEGMTDPLPEAETQSTGGAEALATESSPVNIGGEPDDGLAQEATDQEAPTEEAVGENAASAEAVSEPAPQTTVTTELSAAVAPAEDQDEIFLSTMDAPPPALDALALPTPIATLDPAPAMPMPPPAFGTVYQFDANGLLMPTPDGILSPEGVMLIAGKPPLLPPVRSEVATAAALAAVPVAAAQPSDERPAADGVVSAADASLVTADGAGPVGASATDPADGATPPADPAMAGFRPRPRPEGLAPTTPDDARLAPDSATDVATLRPLPRPNSLIVAASASRPAEGVAKAGVAADLGAQGASLAAQAEAQLATATALEAENPSIVAISMRPAARPRDLSRAVEAAVAAAVRAPEPEAEVIEIAGAPPADLKPEELDELDEPDIASAAPSIPTRASVAKQATFANAINLSKINLIGTYGTDSRRYALIRQANGRYKKVKVGDKIDGGTVKAITDTEVRYQKGGKLVALKMPKA